MGNEVSMDQLRQECKGRDHASSCAKFQSVAFACSSSPATSSILANLVLLEGRRPARLMSLRHPQGIALAQGSHPLAENII